LNYNYPSQLQLPGLGNVRYQDVSPKTICPGQKVVYVGRINGDPGYGSIGSVLEIRRHKAIVELKRPTGQNAKIWHIPYHLLASPQKAA